MQYLPVFLSVFLAEMGDKTQLATLLFAVDEKHSPWGIFLASALALVATSALAVLAGSFAAKYLEGLPLKLIAGAGFVVIGLWTLAEHFRGA